MYLSQYKSNFVDYNQLNYINPEDRTDVQERLEPIPTKSTTASSNNIVNQQQEEKKNVSG